MTSPDLKAKLEKFQCHRCNECCKQPGFVYLYPGEEEAMAAHLKMTVFNFVNEYCELQDRTRLVLKKKNGEECILLNKIGCDVHPAKPRQCKEFPFKWRTARSFDYCKGLQALSS